MTGTESKKLSKFIDDLDDMKEYVENLMDKEQERMDRLSEKALEDGDGESMERTMEALSGAVDAMETLIEALNEALTEDE
ncbi:MAG: hypothetical protein MJ061_04325 [Mailhella sp.]|nr:hypothetical protein [Mailhella sp.]